MHRPSNVDNQDSLKELLQLVNRLSKKRKILFPLHPRTKKNLEKFNVNLNQNPNLIITDPVGYLDFIWLIKNAYLILTDSDGIHEESTFLGVQCLTLRNTTERPITVDVGTNHLIGDDFHKAEIIAEEIFSSNIKNGKIPELWDGKASERIIEILVREFNRRL